MQYPDGMGEREAASTRADLEALKAMQADVSELEHTENLLDRFNVFEAIGFIGQELMHSRLLAFLLDPNESHGLGTSFLEGFLQKVSESTDSVSLPSGGSDLRQATVRTEVPTGDGRMDILLTDKASQWAMMIENKIATTEHSNQLDRYYRSMLEAGPGWDTGWNVACVYLTPTEISLRTKRTFPSVMEQCARYWMESSINLNPGEILSEEKQGAWHPMFVGK